MKKKPNRIIKIILDAMRISFLIFTLITTLSSTLWANKSKAQSIEEVRVSLRLNTSTIDLAIQQLQQISGFNFIYDKNQIKGRQLISVNAVNQSVGSVLNHILNHTETTYRQDGQMIYITKKVGPGIIYGTVKDSVTNETLIGVIVTVKNSNKSAQTDANGQFKLSLAPGNYEVSFRYVGFVTVVKKVILKENQVQQFQISLHVIQNSLNEVVVMGYGTQKKANLTGAVSTVNVDEVLGDRPVSTVGTLLQGIVPGLQVSIGSGEPGSAKNYNIRGATDINTTGNEIKTQAPFIVVDNVPFNGPFNLLDPNDIESITVLKDAGSAAIYGARSAFGVILVTTKKGIKNQKTKFNYSNNLIWASPMSVPQKASVLQTVQSYKDMGTSGYWTGHDVDTWLDLVKKYDENPQNYPLGYEVVNGLRYPLAETNAIDNLIGKSSKQFLNNLSVSGGSDKTTYRLSVGTVNETGIIVPESDKDNYSRYNLKSVISTDVKDWLNIQLDASYYKSVKSYPPGDGFNSATNLGPYVPLEDSIAIEGVTYVNGTPKNDILQSYPTIDRYDDARLTGRVILKPFDGLRITGEYTFDNLRNLNTSYDKINTSVDPRTYKAATAGAGLYSKGIENTDYNAINVFANYDKSVQKHNFSLLMGYNQEESSFEQEKLSRDGVISADYPSISQATGLQTTIDNYDEYAVRGAFGRLNYDYAGKYLVSLTGRYDASSKFPENNRSGFFPSASVGWSIDKENFMEGTSKWLSQLKPRIGFGSVGNQNIDSYAFLPNMDAVNAAWLNDQKQVITLTSPGLVSSNFTWATVQTFNVGLDFALFKNRLSANLDWFKRDTKNMLYEGIQLPAVLGTGSPLQNVAALQSKGFEVQLNWQDKIGKVSYRIAANLSDYRSEITKIKNEAGLLSQYYVGQRLGEIYGYTTQRLYTVNDFIPGTLKDDLTGGTLKAGIPKFEGELPNPGDVLYVDYNGDGIINGGSSTLSDLGDRRIIGNSTPRYQFGLNGGVTWKNLDFSFVLSGVAKQDQWRANILTLPNYYAFGTLYSHQLDYWTASRQNAFYGRTYDQSKGNQPFNQEVQTKYMLDGSYLKIGNLTLGYTIPTNISKKIFIDRLQAFFSVENVFTFDHLPKGLDPEINRDNRYGMGYPFMRQYSFGVNLSF